MSPMRFDDFLRQACPPLDLEWRRYRRRAARHRVEARISELGLLDYADYLERLQTDPSEAARLPELMLVTVSRFFRERERWEALQEKVLPTLLADASATRPLSAWSVGCCGGEEPYTLALLWRHALRPRYPGRSLRILATDLDEASLARAAAAVYSRGSLKEVPEAILGRWFRQDNDLFRLDRQVGRQIVLRRHNFMAEPPPEGIDLALARYLPFTYYRGTRRRQAAERLARALRPGGALMIGRKEELGLKESDLFTPWPGAAGVFRRWGPEGA